MKRLLGKQGLRMLKMVSYLYRKEWVTLEKVSEAIGYSERTLREDIKYLNSIMAPIEIIASTKLGVKLRIPQGYSLKYIHSLLLSDSLQFNLLEAIFLHDYADVAELADALYSSPTVISKAINQINQIIKSHHLEITISPLAISGNEQWVTAYFRSYFLAKYDSQIPLGPELVEPVQVAINRLYKAESATILPMNRNLLVLYGVLRVFRMSRNPQNQYDQFDSQEVYSQGICEYNRALSDLAALEGTHDFFREIWRPSQDEFMCFRMDEFQQLAKTHPAVKQTYQLYTDLADQIEKELDFHFNFKEWFIFNLYNTTISEKYHIPVLTERAAYLLPNIKKRVPFLFLTVSRIVDSLAPKLGLEPEKLLYNVFSSADDFLTTGYQKQPKLKVAIYSNYNNIIVANNWSVIKNTFVNQFDVSIIQSTFADARQEINDNFDLLITDINNLEIGIDYFCIPYDISPKEIAMLEDYYFNAMIAQVATVHGKD